MSGLVRAVTLAGLIGLFAMVLPAVAAATTGIEGTVTEAEAPHTGITGAEACAYDATTDVQVECATTVSLGGYTIPLPAGSYKVGFTATGYQHQYYSGESSFSEGATIVVTSGAVGGIDAEMVESGAGSITGRVTSNGQGVGGVQVCANGSSGGFGGCAETNGNGEYTISGVNVAVYTVSFSPQNNSCEEEQGVKVRCVLNANVIGQSVSGVHVKANTPATVNVTLQAGGQISGTVTNASITHPGLAKVEVCALKPYKYEETEYFGRVRCGYTNPSGQYTISGLGESGSYKVEFNGYICSIPKKGEEECPEVYVTEYYHGQQTAKKGEGVSVTIGANTGGINESLREAFPTTPASTAAPTLTGTAAVGQTLSCSQGSWSHEPTYLLYQWSRNGTAITGQAGSTYVLQAADQGHSITCSVTAGNGAGAATANSNAVAIPVPLALFAGVKVKGSVASVTLRCPGPGACSGVMKIVARVTTRHGRRKKTSNVTIGVASFSMLAGKRVTLRVHLTGSGRKLLGKAGRKGLKVQIAGSGVKAHTAVLRRHRG
ncbi:MAG TPA: carboxypeptidase-like regulatory domain-containing protein, partial [Solirubrobacteraceae bacterium]